MTILIYLYLLSFSLIGYGIVVSKFLQINQNCFGVFGILGITFFAFISYLSSIFINHNLIFNTLIFLLGNLFFFYFLNKIKKFKKELLLLSIICFISIIFVLVSKNHDDFPYYHFPYISLLTEFSHPFGLGQLNNGFRSPSSIFFISSLFYLPKSGIYLFHLTPAFIQIFANIILLKIIFDRKIFSKNRFYNFYSLFAFCFINIFFYRLAEHGTDRSGMILLLISFIYLILIINCNGKLNSNEIDLFKIFSILVFFVISIKPFYLINIPLFLIIFYYSHTRKIFFKLLFTPVFFYSLAFLIFTIFYTFINSGCLIFPLTQACFYDLEWSLNKTVIQDVKVWFELWAKAGANPNLVVENRLEYISGLNWLPNWFQNYFLNKVSDFLLAIVFTILVFYFTYFRLNLKKEDNKIRIYLVYFFLFLCLMEWFFNHPTLRYGGYHILALIFFLPACLYLSKFKLHFKDYYKKTLIMVFIIITIFVSRNISRLINENELYDYNIIKNVNYKFIGGDQDFYFRYNKYLKNKKDFPFLNILGKKITIIGKK